jgi:CubicO group peptidase (beta-lactamase class C family)
MTVHHLLTHSSGLPAQFGEDYEALDRGPFLARAFQTPLATPPGEKYEYSNVGYSVLAAILELRSGMSYEQYLKQALFDKAGMAETGYRLPDFRPEATAIGYRRGSRWGRPNEQPWAADGPYWNLRGNGGILSTAADMLRWHEALAGTSVLSDESKRRMYTGHIEEGPGAGTYYGYGWALFPTTRGTTLITHNGGNGIFFADFLRYPDERVVVFFATNRAAPPIHSVAHTVARIVFDSTFVARLAPAPTESATIPDTPAGRWRRSSRES